jgi:hypothetical protein
MYRRGARPAAGRPSVSHTVPCATPAVGGGAGLGQTETFSFELFRDAALEWAIV